MKNKGVHIQTPLFFARERTGEKEVLVFFGNWVSRPWYNLPDPG